MSIASEIERLINAKVDIKLSIENKGVNVDDDATLDDYPDYIDNIQTGTTPTGTVNITTNGTTDVTNYASANVNVQPNLQSKSETITTNTTTTITPDNGYDGLSGVTVTTNVSGGTTPTKGFVVNSWSSDGLPKELTTYGLSEFPKYGCYNYNDGVGWWKHLEKVTLNNGLTTVNERSYCDCSKLIDIVIPDSVTTLGQNCFISCSNLKKISGNGITSIYSSSANSSSFRNCENLKKVWIGSSITNSGLGRYCFNSATNLNAIYINLPRATVESFTNYQYAFMNNTSKTGIIVCNDDAGFISKADFDALIVN